MPETTVPPWLQKLEVAAKIFAAILIPVVTGLYTWHQTRLERMHNEEQGKAEAARLAQQRTADLLQRQADHLALLLNHLASPNPQARLLGIKLAEFEASRNQLPPEVVPVLVSIASQGTKANEAEASAANQVLSVLPPRVYIHVSNEAQRPIAASIVKTLEAAHYSVPGVQRVVGEIRRNELRYFRPDEKAEAEQIGAVLNRSGVVTSLADYSTYKDAPAVRSRTFEFWLATSSR